VGELLGIKALQAPQIGAGGRGLGGGGGRRRLGRDLRLRSLAAAAAEGDGKDQQAWEQDQDRFSFHLFLFSPFSGFTRLLYHAGAETARGKRKKAKMYEWDGFHQSFPENDKKADFLFSLKQFV
jgi:hypothetical protein